MKRRRLLVDVDEVLALFQEPAFDIIEEVTGKRYRAEDIEEWDIFCVLNEDERRAVFAEIEKPGWCANLKTAPGSEDAISVLREMVDVYPVTSPFHSMPWVMERTKWLEAHYGWKKNEIVHTGAKFLVSGDAFLDDKPEHIDAWTEHHPDGLAMLWHIPNTRLLPYDHVRVSSWGEVIAKVEALVRRPPCP